MDVIGVRLEKAQGAVREYQIAAELNLIEKGPAQDFGPGRIQAECGRGGPEPQNQQEREGGKSSQEDNGGPPCEYAARAGY